LLDPRPMAATILEARRPPWSAPKHADHSSPGPKNMAGRRNPILRVFQRCHAAGQSVARASIPRCMDPCTAARLLQPPQAIKPPLAHPLLANRLAQVWRQV